MASVSKMIKNYKRKNTKETNNEFWIIFLATYVIVLSILISDILLSLDSLGLSVQVAIIAIDKVVDAFVPTTITFVMTIIVQKVIAHRISLEKRKTMAILAISAVAYSIMYIGFINIKNVTTIIVLGIILIIWSGVNVFSSASVFNDKQAKRGNHLSG